MLLDEDNVVPEKDSPDDVLPSPEAEPRVSIVYRNRGVPLYLTVPLILVTGVATFVAARGFATTRHQVVYLPAPPSDAPALPPVFEEEGPPSALAPAVVARAEPLEQPAPQTKESSIASKPIDTRPADADPASLLASGTPTAPATPHALEPPPAYHPPVTPEAGSQDAPAAVEPANQPPPPVRDAVGFDPEALKAAAAEPVEPPRGTGPNRPTDGLEDQPDPNAPIPDHSPLARGAIPRRPQLDNRGRTERMAKARHEANNQRQTFLDELRQILTQSGPNAGEEILALSEGEPIEGSDEVAKAAFGELSGPAARLSVKGQIQLLRKRGVPESIILDHLIDRGSADLGGRRGPRDRRALTIQSARLLLSVPLRSATSTTAKTNARTEG